ncbi:MAG TPA: hypothetical protein EYP23_05940 [Thermoplasmata archaeon]|nr:hypothetical protein [Thermoplasmata archaeon]
MRSYAVVGVVEAILLIGLFAIVLSTVQLVYVPQLMESREASHMDQVANQFAQLKFAVDLQATGDTNVSISVPIVLGSRELPYLITARALGTLSVVENACTLTVNASSQEYVYRLGDIVYFADNAYYVKQSYVLECGAVLLRQGDSETMLAAPSFSSQLIGSTLDLSFHLMNITGYAGRTAASGCTTTYVRTNYSSSSSFSFTDVSRITIATLYPDVWFNYFNASLDSEAVDVTKFDQFVEISPCSGYTIDLSLNVVRICVQIGLGWIGAT